MIKVGRFWLDRIALLDGTWRKDNLQRCGGTSFHEVCLFHVDFSQFLPPISDKIQKRGLEEAYEVAACEKDDRVRQCGHQS